MEPVQPDVEELKGQRQRVEAILVGKLNLADFQNAVPMLRELSLVNDTNDAAKELELHVESVPAFLKPKVWRVDAVAAGDSYRITDLDVQLDGAVFTRLTEAETATVTFSLRRRDNAIPELARLERTVELLPRNQWGGISHMPDLVAAFVQPNEPAVERLLKQAADILRKNGKNPALDGYKGGSKRAWELVSGIWGAVAAMGLDYALPQPALSTPDRKSEVPDRLPNRVWRHALICR